MYDTVCGKIGISVVSYYLKEEEKKLWQLLVKTFIPVASANVEMKKKSSINGVFLRCDLECGKWWQVVEEICCH